MREILLIRVILTCRDLVRDLSYHRAMMPYVEQLRVNIWVYTFNNFMEMAVLNWCHLFGNDTDDLHWLTIMANTDEFREKLLEAVDMNFNEWKAYRKTVIDYRNKDVAHIEVRPEGDVPQMDIALTAAFYYYSVALAEIRTLHDYPELPNNLSQFNDEINETANNYVNTHIVPLFEYAE